MQVFLAVDLVPGTKNPKYTEMLVNTAFLVPGMRFSFLAEDLVPGTKSTLAVTLITECAVLKQKCLNQAILVALGMICSTHHTAFWHKKRSDTMVHFGLLGLIPPVLTIALAFITKDVIISLFLGILSGTLIVAGGNPLIALINLSDLLAGSLNDGWNIRIFLF